MKLKAELKYSRAEVEKYILINKSFNDQLSNVRADLPYEIPSYERKNKSISLILNDSTVKKIEIKDRITHTHQNSFAKRKRFISQPKRFYKQASKQIPTKKNHRQEKQND